MFLGVLMRVVFGGFWKDFDKGFFENFFKKY